MHIKEQNKVIRMKNLWIFQDYEGKIAMALLNYENGISTFQGFSLEDDNKKEESFYFHNGRKVNAKKLQLFIYSKGQKITNVESISSTITFFDS